MAAHFVLHVLVVGKKIVRCATRGERRYFAGFEATFSTSG